MNKWDTHIAPYMTEIESWAMRGASEKEIADKLGVSYSTFRKYVKDKSELQTMLNRSKRHVKKVIDQALTKEKRSTNFRDAAPRGTMAPDLYVKTTGVARPDQNGTHRGPYEKNKKRIYATQDVCGICGKPVDKSLKYPHPMSPCIDHIIPVAKGGHPSDINNLQLAHWTCNRQKSDKMIDTTQHAAVVEVISNRILPLSIDWSRYKKK